MFGIHDPYLKNKHVFHGSCHIFFVAWDMFLLMISLVGVTWQTCHLPGRRFEVAKQHGKQGRLQIMDEQPWHDAEDGHMIGPRPRVSNSPKNKLETDLLRRGGLTLFLAGFWDLQITSDLRSWLILREQRFLKNYSIWSNSSDRKHEFWVASPKAGSELWKGPMGPLIMLGRCWIHVLKWRPGVICRDETLI